MDFSLPYLNYWLQLSFFPESSPGLFPGNSGIQPIITKMTEFLTQANRRKDLSLPRWPWFFICFVSVFSLCHFLSLCLVSLLNYFNNYMPLLFHICSGEQTSTYFFSIHYILDFYFLYHKFMDNLVKLGLQVANWLIPLIYTYLYLHNMAPKLSGKSALLLSRYKK